MSGVSRLKSLDFYRKIPRDLTEASLSGASLSIVAAVAMIFLFGMELQSYMAISTETMVIVDQSLDGDLLRINFNFSFPSLSCEFASVDITDVLGTARYNLTKTVKKMPVNKQLQVVGPEHHPDPVPTPTKAGDEHHPALLHHMADHQNGALQLTDDNFKHYAAEYPILLVNFYAPWCPWCQRLEPAWEKASATIHDRYNPETDGRIRLAKVDCTIYAVLCHDHHIQGYPSIRIFRKGNDLRDTHSRHDHESYYGERDTDSLVKFAETLVPAAVLDGHSADENEGSAGAAGAAAGHAAGILRRAPQASGCNIEGFVLVKKVPGNLMVSAHSGAHSFDANTMNMSHTVHLLSFGRPLTRRRMGAVERLKPHLKELESKARLEDHTFVSQHDNVTHDHFMQVVMTEVAPLRFKYVKDTQHRHTLQSYEYTVHSNVLQSKQVPVARFHYELSPMQVLIRETTRSFSHFLTNLCAIIGGVFTVAGIADSIFHGAMRMVKKNNLGKQI